MRFSDDPKADKTLKALLIIFFVLVILIMIIPQKQLTPKQEAAMARQRRVQDSLCKRDLNIR
jgi:hypothetical protein